MAFGRKKHEADEVPARTGREIRTTALVVNTARPMTKTLGGSDRGRVYVLVENGPEPIYVGSKFRLTPERWLVTGMRVGVWIDPASPEDFAIDWDSIPSIEDRARANDATLADPRAGERAVIDAMRAAGRMGDTESVPEAIRELAARAEVARQTAAPDRFEEAMDRRRDCRRRRGGSAPWFSSQRRPRASIITTTQTGPTPSPPSVSIRRCSPSTFPAGRPMPCTCRVSTGLAIETTWGTAASQHLCH